MSYIVISPLNAAKCEYTCDVPQVLWKFAREVVSSYKDPALWWVRVVSLSCHYVNITWFSSDCSIKKVETEIS